MPVTDRQVATLRAQLAGDLEEHKRLLRQFDSKSDGRPYVVLTNAAFFEAVDRQFGKDSTSDDMIEFIADVRSRSDRVRDELDPVVSERVLLAAVADGDMTDLDPKVARNNQRILLAAMVADEQFDDAGLDDFMAKARALADSLLG
jgi:hypothetical protein